MKIELLWHTPEPEKQIAIAIRTCYSPKSTASILEELVSQPQRQADLIRKCIRDKSFDVIEHASISYKITGVSRSLTHQLVRHRLFRYDQLSQRFADSSKETFVIPPSVQSNPEALRLYNEHCESSMVLFKKLKELEIPKEDARFILPTGITTNIVMTGNCRAWMHFFYMRTAI
jgi:thymidylate synthase (FAD)